MKQEMEIEIKIWTWIGGCQNPVAVSKQSIHSYEGNPINRHNLLLQCFGRAQDMDRIMFMTNIGWI